MSKLRPLRILFVCHGNICRSPMAEFILRDMAEKKGIADRLTIASAATSTDEIYGGRGNPVYPAAKAELAAHGIRCDGKQAVKVRCEDYDRYDLIIGMDSANIRNMNRIFGGDPEGKIRKMMDYTSRGGDVADPWYSDRFDIAYREIFNGCEGLMAEITK